MADLDELLAGNAKQPSKQSTLGKLADLLERSGVDLDSVARVKTVRAWQGFYKDADGQAQTVDMHGIEFVPTFADGPAWPVVQQGPAVKLPANRTQAAKADGWRTAVVLPDIQVGLATSLLVGP